ncbi:MAG TPA: VanZ family protein [Pyrinomonadaceae bacterium]|jgi:VanZ family protein|nr:VanZ family protein [Pyrinomonadaceae bacterium]
MHEQTKGRVLSRYVPLVVWLCVITYASSDGFSASNTSRIIGPVVLWLFPNTSEETMTLIHLIVRKIAHFTEYGILGFLAVRAFRTSPGSYLSRHWFVISFLLVVVYALLDEYHQSFVPSRTSSIYDSFIDMTGGLTVILLLRLWYRERQPSSISTI